MNIPVIIACAELTRRDHTQEAEMTGETIPRVERDLIKLMLVDGRFVHIPDDLKEYAFRSEAGRNIYSAIENKDQKHIDIQDLKDKFRRGYGLIYRGDRR